MLPPLPRFAALVGSLASCLALGACGDGPPGPGGPGAGEPDPFDAGVTSLVIEIDRASGAAPYTGGAGTSGDVWALSETNFAALLEGTEVEVSLPHTLDGMEELTDVSAASYTSAAILEIADAHRDAAWDEATATLYAVWLDGRFEDSSGVRDNVLGVSLGDTGVIAMFKPVIETLSAAPGPLGDTVRKFGEQTTFIHEGGHALGLVNNGLPLQSDHQDEEHGAHCTNDDCVMYWANEGAGDLAAFVGQYVASGSSVVFRQECLADARAAAGD